MDSTSTNLTLPSSSSHPPQKKHPYPVPTPGVYAPAITFFNPATDTLDLPAQKKYFAHLAHRTPLTGLIILGTNAEPFLLSCHERKTLLHLARASVPASYPLIAGVSGHSTSQTLSYIYDAHAAGADYALVLPCAYYKTLVNTVAMVKEFYAQVAAQSPLPIIVYNFPAVCNGVDLDSECIADLAGRHANIVGVKLTCGSVAKVARLAAVLAPERFAVFGGQADFLLGGLAVGAAGCIGAFANVCPRSVVRVFELWKAGRRAEAVALQQRLSLAEGVTKGGVGSLKFAVGVTTAPRAGVEDAVRLLRPRRPYEAPSEEVKARIVETMEGLSGLEDEGLVEDRGGKALARL